MFIEQVREQLEIMSEEEKDLWILTRAESVEESEQYDFLISLMNMWGKINGSVSVSDQEILVSVLEMSWNRIVELVEQLNYYRYIDDQLEIDEIWEICEMLVNQIDFSQEDWCLRRKILRDMVENTYYDYYGCSDPMYNLEKRLCITENEFLEYADILNEFEYCKEKAARIYHQYGRDEKYVLYLESHLAKESSIYEELIGYYTEHGNKTRALEVAEQALVRCKDDLTNIFIYLLTDAKENGEGDRYKKFYSSAKRRRVVNISKIDKALENE